ncbi:MAG: LptA/OstA family protein [Alphaproteobacteria bacterium]|nr:LptA/OstA family protein [Alphaproteobacteria bacterium]
MRSAIMGIMAYGALTGFASAAPLPAPAPEPAPQQIEVTADQSLEWYQDQNMYVARGNAKAVRGTTTITADLLTAHERAKAPDDKKTSVKAPKQNSTSGDIDKMTADGHVLIVRPNTRITGEHAVDDADAHVTTLTGNNLRYETDKQVVTARDTLEYWDDKKIAVARGHAVAIKGNRHVEGDVLTAEFRAQPNGQDQLYKMTATGNVTVITGKDVVRGEKAVYNAAADVAIITGHVRITRADGTQLTGDVAESNFATNQSRLMNDGSGRVRALLPVKSDGSDSGKKGNAP